MRRFTPCATGFCSGWMAIRGQRRRRGFDRGFVLSDHADWDGLLSAIADSRPKRVLTTHGRDGALIRYLRERGVDAAGLELSRRSGDEQESGA
jgi:putative mRNA 3-end processing factor